MKIAACGAFKNLQVCLRLRIGPAQSDLSKCVGLQQIYNKKRNFSVDKTNL